MPLATYPTLLAVDEALGHVFVFTDNATDSTDPVLLVLAQGILVRVIAVSYGAEPVFRAPVAHAIALDPIEASSHPQLRDSPL